MTSTPSKLHQLKNHKLKFLLTFVSFFAKTRAFHQSAWKDLRGLEDWVEWKPRPISFDYYDYSDVRHKPARVDLVSCGVGDPQVKLFPRALRTLSNGQEWKWISSVGCKITSIYTPWLHLQFRFEVYQDKLCHKCHILRTFRIRPPWNAQWPRYSFPDLR